MCKFFTEKRLGLSEHTVRIFGYVMNVFLNFWHCTSLCILIETHSLPAALDLDQSE